MVKSKVIQSIIFSTVLFLMILLGSLYTSGLLGAIKTSGDKSSLTNEGLLGGGLISLSFVVILWILGILYTPLMRWKGKSNSLTSIFILTFTVPVISMIWGIIYLGLKKHQSEKIKIKARSEK